MFRSTHESNVAGFYYYSLIYKLASLNELAKEPVFCEMVEAALPQIAAGRLALNQALNTLFARCRKADRIQTGRMLAYCIRQRVAEGKIAPSRAIGTLLKMVRERLLPIHNRFKLIAIQEDFCAAHESNFSYQYAARELAEYLSGFCAPKMSQRTRFPSCLVDEPLAQAIA